MPLIDSQESEREFSRTLSEPVFASKEENINEHWDVMDESTGYRYDVKAMKKRRRHDQDVNKELHWIELINVKGNAGWLYGNATHIVFEYGSTWVVVDRAVLSKHIDHLEQVEVRTRYGRKDKIVAVKTIDLIILSDNVIKKA